MSDDLELPDESQRKYSSHFFTIDLVHADMVT